jgi:hypothetical protein
MMTYTDMDITIVPPGHRVPAVAVIPWKGPSDIPWVPGSKGVNRYLGVNGVYGVSQGSKGVQGRGS